MSTDKLSLRYAKALFDEAQSSNLLDKVYEDINFVLTTVSNNKELKLMYQSPIVSSNNKLAVSQSIFKGNVQDLVSNFITLLIDKKRESVIVEISKYFIKLYNTHKGISEVNVTVATQMDATTEAKIASFVKSTLGTTTVKIHTKIDATILGGFIINFGDKIYDASILQSLNKLKQELVIN